MQARIEYCVHEERSKVPQLIKTFLKADDEILVEVRKGKSKGAEENYDVDADYVIEREDGTVVGIERKSVGDLYNSNIPNKRGKRRVDDQLRRLVKKYGKYSFLLIEDTEPHPRQLRAIKGRRSNYCATEIIKKAAYTKATHLSLTGTRIIISRSRKHSAQLLLEIARGIRVC